MRNRSRRRCRSGQSMMRMYSYFYLSSNRDRAHIKARPFTSDEGTALAIGYDVKFITTNYFSCTSLDPRFGELQWRIEHGSFRLSGTIRKAESLEIASDQLGDLTTQ